MTMADYLQRAIIVAIHAHAGQRDKAGMPYILHPLAVAQLVPTLEAKVVAILHDVVEDSPISLQDLQGEPLAFPEEIVKAVAAITKDIGETYMQYLVRLAGNHIALTVKLADLEHNLSRINEIPDTEEREYLRDKYTKARNFLQY